MGFGAAVGPVRWLLHAEGFALLAVAVAAYAWLGAAWWVFALLPLAPGLPMLGYLGGERVGAMAYNLAHSTVGPLWLGRVGRR